MVDLRNRPEERERRPDIMERLDQIQALLEAQMQENANLRRRVEELEQRQGSEGTQVEQQAEVDPVIPPAAVHERAPEPQPVLNLEPLYERFRRMRPPEFEGSTNPLEAEDWLSSLQVIMEFMNLTDREKVACASFVLRKDARFWWDTVRMRRNVSTMS